MKSVLRLVRRGDDQFAAEPIERAHHGDLLRLPGCRHAQVGAPLGPGAGEIRMRQRLALVGEQQNDIAGLGLRLAQFEPQADTIDLVAICRPFSVCRGRRKRNLFSAAPWRAASGRSRRPRDLDLFDEPGERPVRPSATGAEQQ